MFVRRRKGCCGPRRERTNFGVGLLTCDARSQPADDADGATLERTIGGTKL